MDHPILLDTFASQGKSLRLDLGATIFQEGDPGDAFYIVRSGRLRVLRKNDGERPQTVGYLYPGDHFGEGALLTGRTHRATVRAAEPSEVLRVSGADFFKVVSSNPDLKAYLEDRIAHIAYRDFTRYLKAGNGHVSGEAMQDLFRSLKREALPSETCVVRQGDTGERFYLIGSGHLRVISLDGSGRERRAYELKPGDFFGVQALLENTPQATTITAVTDVVVYSLSKVDFDRFVGRIPPLRQALEGAVLKHTQKRSAAPVPIPVNGPTAPQMQRTKHTLTPEASSQNGKARKIRRFPFLKQHDQTDCGAACLGMICKYYGMSIGLNRLRDMANVSRHGASLAGLAEAAESLGFVTRGVRTGYEQLLRTDLPAVIHWEGNHFIVLFQITANDAMVADPRVGIRKLSRKAFEAGWTHRALLLEYTDRVAENEPSRSSFRRFFPLVRPYVGILCEILLASLVLSLFGLASPIFTQTIVDQVLVHQDRDLLNLMLIGMVVIALFQMGTSALRTYLIAYVSARLSITMLSRFYRHLLGLSMRFFALRRTGDLTTRFGENATIQALLTGTTVSVVLDVTMLFVYLGLMLYYHVQLTLCVLAFMPLTVILTLIYTPVLKSLSQRAFLAQAEQSSVLIDSLHGVDAVKASAIERSIRWKWEDRYTKEIQIGFHGMKIGMLFGSVGGLLNLFSSTFILWYGATLVIDGELSVGQLMAFNVMIGNVTGPIMGLIDLWPQVQEARIALERLNDIYDTPMEASRHGDHAVTLQRMEGRIAFEKVFFRYGAGAEQPYVLNDINLTVQPGQKVAVVGRSSAGKTTLVKLIPRLFDPTEGRVTLDGIDLRDFNPAWLRRQVGMVLQEPFLFSGSIAENIALGEEEVDMDRVVEAARLTNVHGFASDLPMGYETRVGEQGVGLSGGQRQRVAIARALYTDPRILIFDEATNALDTESEQAIQENLEDILKDRTAFVIAHRLSTVRNADLIVVLDKGHIVETGDHASLMARQGLYYYLTGQQLDAA